MRTRDDVCYRQRIQDRKFSPLHPLFAREKGKIALNLAFLQPSSTTAFLPRQRDLVVRLYSRRGNDNSRRGVHLESELHFDLFKPDTAEFVYDRRCCRRHLIECLLERYLCWLGLRPIAEAYWLYSRWVGPITSAVMVSPFAILSLISHFILDRLTSTLK